MNYLGDVRLGTTLDFKFTTRRFTTGAPFALSGGVISAYVDNGTTELTAGITLTADFDSRTGLNHVRVVASSGNGYASGTDVVLVITTGTVDSVSVVGEVIGAFSIEFRSALMPTTAARTLDVSATGEAGVDWANVGSPTTTLNLSGTTIKTATDVETDTNDIQARLPAALVGGRIDANIGAISTDQTAADNLETAFDGGSYNVGGGGIVAASVTGAVGSVTGSVGSVTGAVGSVTGNVGGNVTGSVGSVATDGITSASLATSAITEIQAGLATAAALTVVDDFLDTEINAIKAKTDALPTDPADASDIAASFATVNATLATLSGYVDTEVAAIKAKTDNLPTDPADASDIAASFGTVNATLSTIAGYIDTEVAAIKAKTDNLPTDPADASDIAAAFATVNGTLGTIAGYIDTEVAAILADTDELQTKLIPLVELTSNGYQLTDEALAQVPSGSSPAAVATAVWAESTRTLTAGTNIVLAKGTGVTGFNDLSAAQVNAEADQALADVGVTTTVTGRIDVAVSTRLATASYTAPDNASITAILADTDELEQKLTPLVELSSEGYRYTDDALSQAPTGGSAPTAAAIADAVWDEALAAHLTPGTAGAAITDASLGADLLEDLTELTSNGPRFTEIALELGPTSAGASDPWTAPLPGSYSVGQAGYIVGTNLNAQVSTRATQTSVDTIDGIVDAILVDTAEIGAAGAGLSAIPWNSAWDAEVQSEVADALTAHDVPTEAEMNARTLPSAQYATAAALQVVDDFIDTEVAAIKAKTDALPADPADASDIAGSFATVNATLATIAGYVDTEVAAIKAKTDNLPSDPADASDIASAFGTVNATLATLSGYVDTEVAAIKSTTDKIELMLEETSDGWRFEAFALAGAGDAILRTPMAEEYAADGAPMTAEQAMHMIWALLAERAVSGTTLTARKLDGSTAAMTFTLNSATTPTEQTRAT